MNKLWLSLKMQFRVPVSVFFALFFPVLMTVIMLVSYGNFSIGGGYHFIDKYLMISIGIGLIPLTMISFPMWIAQSVGSGIYLRLKTLGVNIGLYVLSEIFSYVIMSLVSTGVNISVSWIIFGSKIPDIAHFIVFLFQIEYCVVVFLVMGAVLAFVFKNTNTIFPLGMIIMFCLYMISGVFVQYDELPNVLKTIGGVVPWKYLMNNFYSIWSNKQLLDISFLKCNTVWILTMTGIFVIVFIIRKIKGGIISD